MYTICLCTFQHAPTHSLYIWGTEEPHKYIADKQFRMLFPADWGRPWKHSFGVFRVGLQEGGKDKNFGHSIYTWGAAEQERQIENTCFDQDVKFMSK